MIITIKEEPLIQAVLEKIRPLSRGTALKGAQIGEPLGVTDVQVRICTAELRRRMYPIASEVAVGYFYGRHGGDLNASHAEYNARIMAMVDCERALRYMKDCLNAGMSPEDIQNVTANHQLSLL